MIKYNNSNISDWYFDTSDIIKVYRNNAVCYYKITGGGDVPTAQTPCYAVVDDISQYSDTEFEDVFNKADSKWYKLNNLNQYEEYGVYGSGRNITHYEGKLTIDSGYEYIYSGSSWTNVGEVSGSSRVPNGYTQLNYIENASSAYINLSTDPYSSTTNSFTVECTFSSYTQSGLAYLISCENASASPYYGFIVRYNGGTLKLEGGSVGRDTTAQAIDNGDGTSSFTFHSDSTTYTNNNTPISLFAGLSGSSPWRQGKGRFYSMTMTLNNSLIRDVVPCKRNSDNKVGAYDVVNDVFYTCPDSSYEFVAGSESGNIEYPLYYDEKQDPLNNLSFSSMTEAEEYECPWVGMQATIDGVKYVFSGDSQSGYEWVERPSRLPIGYTEVEYIQNTGTSYLNIAFTPNQDTRVLCDMQMVTTTNYGRLWGAGAWNNAAGIMIDYTSTQFEIKWLGKTTWSTYTSFQRDYNKHTYDYNKNYVYIDSTLVGSNTYTVQTASDPIGVFTYIGRGRPSQSGYWGQEHYKGKMFSFQVYDNGTLVRDLVPCKRDSDNEVGAYDIINDVFYTVPTGYTTDKLIAGDPI